MKVSCFLFFSFDFSRFTPPLEELLQYWPISCCGDQTTCLFSLLLDLTTAHSLARSFYPTDRRDRWVCLYLSLDLIYLPHPSIHLASQPASQPQWKISSGWTLQLRALWISHVPRCYTFPSRSVCPLPRLVAPGDADRSQLLPSTSKGVPLANQYIVK